MSHFFNRKETCGQCHKFTAEKIKEAQRLLDLSHSQQGTAKLIGVSESAIRYHINAGTFMNLCRIAVITCIKNVKDQWY